MIVLMMVFLSFLKAPEDGPHHRHMSSPSPPSLDHVSSQHCKRKSPRQSNMMILEILLSLYKHG